MPESLSSSFQNPPASAKPWTYWFWINGNVTREGITADLEAMHRVGIGGVLIMEVDTFVPKGPVRFLSPEWRQMFQHVLKEAARLGIEVNMNNDGGWAGSGGPWIPPALSMQMTVSSESRVSGPRHFAASLPRPKATHDYYRDIAVLAFPTPPADKLRMADADPVITWGVDRRPLDAAKLADSNAATVEELPALQPNETHVVNIEFPRPFSARALTLSLDRLRMVAKGVLAVSDNGRQYRTVREFTARWPLATANFEAVSSRHFRISLTPEGRTAATLPLGELELVGGGRIEGITGKAAYVNEPFLTGGAGQRLPAGMAVGRVQVQDLSARMDANGRLEWDVPPGDWTLLRIGHTVTGVVNHAPVGAMGLECDKLSKAALDVHFENMMAKLIADQKALGVNSLRYVHTDSWEAGSQNWTLHMREEFRTRRGYDPLPFLPALTGRAVESQEVTERFLWDLRQTIADLVNDNYAGHLRDLSHRNGLQFSIEAYGNGPLDVLPYAGRADLLITEFWTGMEPWWGGIREMTSAAHSYGQPILAAEAFTSRSPAGKWQNHPFRMKPLGDQMFAAGINRFIFHRFAMQPWLNRVPGMAMGPYGIEFDRTVTWWEQSKAYLTYLARCQYLLQQGRFVADVAYLSSDRVPTDFHEPPTLTPETPPGYDYDMVSAELLARMKVEGGRLVLPSGMSYRVLVLPAANTMRLAQIRKLKELVEAGATVVGPPPSKSPSLAEYGAGDAEVRRLAAELWGACDGANLHENLVGKGKVTWGKPLVNVLNEAGAPPDFSSLGVEAGKQIRAIHRTVDGKEIYFVASGESQAATFLCTFRVAGKRPELWWPDSGRIQQVAAYDQQASGTRLPIRLDPYGSVFVVFRDDLAPEPVSAVLRDGVEVSGLLSTSATDLRGKMQGFVVEPDGPTGFRLEAEQPGTYAVKAAGGQQFSAIVEPLPDPVGITGPWDLSFPKGWGAPERVSLDRLISWTAHPDDAVKHFSGTATYRRRISIPPGLLVKGRALYLDLGRVEVIAEVKWNGKDLGTLWKPPFRVEITDVAKAGENDLEVKVVNLWPNRMIGDEQLPPDAEWEYSRLKGWPQWFLDGKLSSTGRRTFTTWKHWRKGDALLESGLLGPVRIEAAARVRLERTLEK
ncbi:MAG TPA: glycosyl hydrolase [Bryobacteraceae bacterium]|nr:glycosyl hydrolase [Bryobacteraceae bacterium]